jgi:hypothetical protein
MSAFNFQLLRKVGVTVALSAIAAIANPASAAPGPSQQKAEGTTRASHPVTPVAQLQQGGNAAQKQAIEAAVRENLRALNAEDIDAYMATIDENSPVYDFTRSFTQQLIDNYNLRYEINSLEVISQSSNEAQVQVTQTTTKIDGPEFRNNRIQAVHILKKSNGEWKIFATEVRNVEYLD